MGRRRANDDIPQDEMTLARLIQNAAARGLVSCQSAEYRDGQGNECSARRAVSACAIGAAKLRPKVKHLYGFALGNDTLDHKRLPDDEASDAGESALSIGAAYEQALRPEASAG